MAQSYEDESVRNRELGSIREAYLKERRTRAEDAEVIPWSYIYSTVYRQVPSSTASPPFPLAPKLALRYHKNARLHFHTLHATLGATMSTTILLPLTNETTVLASEEERCNELEITFYESVVLTLSRVMWKVVSDEYSVPCRI